MLVKGIHSRLASILPCRGPLTQPGGEEPTAKVLGESEEADLTVQGSKGHGCGRHQVCGAGQGLCAHGGLAQQGRAANDSLYSL